MTKMLSVTALLLNSTFSGASHAQCGLFGFAAYIACWVFLFPVMLILSFLRGFIAWLLLRQSQR